MVERTMNWEMLAAVGQFAAVLVGIPSVLYLALQIREQTKERRQAAVHALTEQWGDLTRSLHDQPEMAEVFLRGVHSFNDLDTVAKVRFSAFFNRFLNIFEGMYFSHRQGILIGSSWAAMQRIVEDFFSQPGVQQWWQTRKRWHTAEFARVVDEIVARGDRPGAFAHYKVEELTASGSRRGS